MKALIVGGGVAGPATALALHGVGIDSLVLEGRPADAMAEGSYLTLAPNGVHALAELGVLAEAGAVGFPTRRNDLVAANGRPLGSVTLGEPLADGTPALTCSRPALAGLLAAACRGRGIEVRYAARVASARETADGVEVTLEDGSREAADLLVGADGVRSRVRGTIDPLAPEGRYVGLTNFGGVTRRTPLAHELPDEAWHFVFGRKAFFGAHRTPAGDVVWFANVPRSPIGADERARTTHEQWRNWLVGLFDGDAGPAARLIADGELELAGDSTYDLGRVPLWHRGRMLVIGDAAHAPAPSSGQGASMALEDAVELARCLRDLPPQGAFAAYERARRDRVERVIAMAARTNQAKAAGPVAAKFRDLLMPFFLEKFGGPDKTAWQYTYRIDWEATVRSRSL